MECFIESSFFFLEMKRKFKYFRDFECLFIKVINLLILEEDFYFVDDNNLIDDRK